MTPIFPIITTHRTFADHNNHLPPWLVVSLMQAHLTNPQSPIICITDQEEISEVEMFPLLRNIRFIKVRSLDGASEEFRSRYFHLTKQPYEFERACIERWFLIHECARQIGITHFFHMDTDVLLLCDISEAAVRFEGADCTTLNDCSWGTSHFYNTAVLSEFCEMVTAVYRRKGPIWRKALRWTGLLDPSKGVQNLSDMFLIQMFHSEFLTGRTRNLVRADLPLLGRLFDPGLTNPLPGVEMEGELKRLVWQDSCPYVIMSESKELVKLDCLHFAGMVKHLIIPTFNRLHEKAVAAAGMQPG